MHSNSSMLEASTVSGPRTFLHWVYESSIQFPSVPMASVGDICIYSSEQWKHYSQHEPTLFFTTTLIQCHYDHWVSVSKHHTSCSVISIGNQHPLGAGCTTLHILSPIPSQATHERRKEGLTIHTYMTDCGNNVLPETSYNYCHLAGTQQLHSLLSG